MGGETGGDGDDKRFTSSTDALLVGAVVSVATAISVATREEEVVGADEMVSEETHETLGTMDEVLQVDTVVEEEEGKLDTEAGVTIDEEHGTRGDVLREEEGTRLLEDDSGLTDEDTEVSQTKDETAIGGESLVAVDTMDTLDTVTVGTLVVVGGRGGGRGGGRVTLLVSHGVLSCLLVTVKRVDDDDDAKRDNPIQRKPNTLPLLNQRHNTINTCTIIMLLYYITLPKQIYF